MKRVLVLCTGNSCRSIMAEALINALGAGRYEAVSAGSTPVGYVHPKSIETLQRHGVDPGTPRSTSWDAYAGQHFDLVITVCDAAAAESCPAFLGKHEKLHWSTPDPAGVSGTEDEISAAFDEAFGILKERVERRLLNLVLSADNAEDLLAVLAAIDISVPGRTDGRTTEHTERYSICRLLSTLAKTGYLSYPLSLTKRERPDFLLTCNGQKIGIEVTEATSTDYSSYQALVEHQKPEHFIEPCHFRHGRKIGKARQQELLQTEKLTSTGWVGDEAEKEWSLFMKDAIEKKHQKLQEQSFEKFDQNWLLIYDNCPVGFFEKGNLIPYIEELFPHHIPPCFDLVLIEGKWTEEDAYGSEAKIFAVSKQDHRYFSVEDVWKNNCNLNRVDEMDTHSPLGPFERYLSLWVALCIAAGVGLGVAAPSVFQTIAGMEVASVNLVVAIFIWVMIYPMMVNVDFASIKDVGRKPKGLCITLVVNWLIKPFTMAALGVLFFEHIFAGLVAAETAKEYIAGMILLGVAPCTAMVFVWSQLVRGDANYTLVQVSINDIIMIFAFAPLAALLLGVTDIIVPWETLLLSVILYVVIPLAVGYVTRKKLDRSGNHDRIERFTARVKPFSIIGLLATVVLLFGFQAETILDKPLVIGLIAVPLLIQSYGIFVIAYGWAYLWRVPFTTAAPAALIGTSNFFELAVAVAISLFGLHSGAALATVVGVLVEVPVMLSLVMLANRTRGYFQ